MWNQIPSETSFGGMFFFSKNGIPIMDNFTLSAPPFWHRVAIITTVFSPKNPCVLLDYSVYSARWRSPSSPNFGCFRTPRAVDPFVGRRMCGQNLLGIDWNCLIEVHSLLTWYKESLFQEALTLSKTSAIDCYVTTHAVPFAAAVCVG